MLEPQLEPDQEPSLETFESGWRTWCSNQDFWQIGFCAKTYSRADGYFQVSFKHDAASVLVLRRPGFQYVQYLGRDLACGDGERASLSGVLKRLDAIKLLLLAIEAKEREANQCLWSLFPDAIPTRFESLKNLPVGHNEVPPAVFTDTSHYDFGNSLISTDAMGNVGIQAARPHRVYISVGTPVYSGNNLVGIAVGGTGADGLVPIALADNRGLVNVQF